MDGPSIRNTLRIPKHNMTYHVMAYRTLTRKELLESVAQFLAQPKIRRRKTPLRNQTITILTVHGATPGL